MSELDGQVAVPRWMVSLAVWVLGALGTGATMTIALTVHHVFRLQEQTKDLSAHVAAIQVKEKDLISAMNDVSRGIEDLKRDVAVLKSRMP